MKKKMKINNDFKTKKKGERCVCVSACTNVAAFGRGGKWEIVEMGGKGGGDTHTAHTQRLTRFPAAARLDLGSLIFIHQRRATERETG